MFTGVTAHHDAGRVASYEQARAALERASKTPTGRARVEKRWGFHLGLNRNHGVTWVRECNDGAVAFRLYDTDVVLWHPDNSVEIDNFGTVTTSAFAHQFLPSGIWLAHQVERRSVGTAGHRGIYYRVGEREVTRSWGTYRTSVNNVCFGSAPRFRETPEGWRPDPDTLDKIIFPVLDQKRARALSRRYPFKDFENWLSMAPLHMRLDHEGWHPEECLEALEKRDFQRAAVSLPLVASYAFGTRTKALPIVAPNRDFCVAMSSVRKLKLAMWDAEDLFSDEEFLGMPAAEFTRRMARVREMRALGLAAWRYGAE